MLDYSFTFAVVLFRRGIWFWKISFFLKIELFKEVFHLIHYDCSLRQRCIFFFKDFEWRPRKSMKGVAAMCLIDKSLYFMNGLLHFLFLFPLSYLQSILNLINIDTLNEYLITLIVQLHKICKAIKDFFLFIINWRRTIIRMIYVLIKKFIHETIVFIWIDPWWCIFVVINLRSCCFGRHMPGCSWHSLILLNALLFQLFSWRIAILVLENRHKYLEELIMKNGIISNLERLTVHLCYVIHSGWRQNIPFLFNNIRTAKFCPVLYHLLYRWSSTTTSLERKLIIWLFLFNRGWFDTVILFGTSGILRNESPMNLFSNEFLWIG